MKINQTQKRLRFTRIEEFLSGHEEIVGSVTAFREDFDHYGELVAELVKLARRQVVASKGQTAAKAESREEMTELVLDLASRIRLYAQKIGDTALAVDVKTTKTDLIYRRGADSLSRAERVIEVARQVQPAMEKDYNLTSEAVDEAAAAVEAFKEVLNAPALAIDEHSVTTRAIEETISKLGKWVKDRITPHVHSQRRSHPDFVASYDQINTLEKRRGQQDAAEEETPAPSASQPEAHGETGMAEETETVEKVVPVTALSPTHASRNGNGSSLATSVGLSR